MDVIVAGLRQKGCVCRLLTGCLLVLPISVAAQTGMQFQSIRQSDGLSSNFVRTLEQDHEGFIWIGTENGLDRYDGNNFLEFTFDPEDPQTLNHDWIDFVLEDSQQLLWVGTSVGLNRLNRTTGKFERIVMLSAEGEVVSNGVLSGGLYEDDEKNLWVLTDKGDVYKIAAETKGSALSTGKPVLELLKGREQLAPRFEAFILKAGEQLWLTTRSGIARVDIHTGELDHFLVPEWTIDRKASAKWSTVYDGKGHIIASKGRNLYYLGISEQCPEFRRLEYYFNPVLPQRLPDGFIASLVLNGSDRLLVGAVIAGEHRLFQLDLKTGAFSWIEPDVSIANFNLAFLFSDRNQNLWLASFDSGIKVGTRSKKLFTLYEHDSKEPNSIASGLVRTFAEDDNGHLWVGILHTGLDEFEYRNEKIEKIREIRQSNDPVRSLSDDEVVQVIKGAAGDLWIATNLGGLFRMDPLSGQFTNYRHDAALPTNKTIADNRIWGLAADPDGNIWIATWNNGLNRLDPRTGEIEHFLTAENQPAPCSSQLRSLHLDKHGILWIGTVEGLCRMDTRTQTFTSFTHLPEDPESLSNNLVWGSYVDQHDNLWVATNIGLNKYDPESGTFERFYETDGLPGNSVYDLIEDQLGNLWVSTDNGLARMLIRNGRITFQPFTLKNGLPTTSFLPKARFLNEHTGQLYFGTTQGIVVVEPAILNGEPPPSPQLILHAVSTFNPDDKRGKPGVDYFISDKPKHITLNHWEHFVDFTISDLSWNLNRNLKYEYRMKGLNQQWLELGEDMQIHFTNLPTGQYTLQARTRGLDDTISGEVDLLYIEALPPWWRSLWAYTVYALTILIVGYSIRRNEMHRRDLKQQAEIARARAEEQQKQAEKIEKQADQLERSLAELQRKNQEILMAQQQLIQQEKLASLGQLTAGIAHEIKNPLNFVNNFAEGTAELIQELRDYLEDHRQGISGELMQQLTGLADELHQNAMDIRSNGVRIDRIIRSMMEHARGAGGVLQASDLNQLVDDNLNLAYHSYRGLDSGFNLSIQKEFDRSINAVNIFPQELGRALINLLNNACYAVNKKQKQAITDYHPTLTVSTSRLDQGVEIRIVDNGTGIPDDLKARIFEPFFTTKETGSGNSGLGLSISYDIIVKQHHGQLLVDSVAGEFTEFRIILPE